VAEKIMARNALIVVQDQNHPLLLSDEFSVDEMHWIDPAESRISAHECAVKTRYRQTDLQCSLLASDAGWRVRLKQSARAVTPGQYAVFYQGERCVGGGIIAQRFNSQTAPVAQRINYNSLLSVEGL
jgi:tRNA-specific 2-thiouridylase